MSGAIVGVEPTSRDRTPLHVTYTLSSAPSRRWPKYPVHGGTVLVAMTLPEQWHQHWSPGLTQFYGDAKASCTLVLRHDGFVGMHHKAVGSGEALW